MENSIREMKSILGRMELRIDDILYYISKRLGNFEL